MQTQTGTALPCFLVRVGTWISKFRGLRGFNAPATRLFEHAPSPLGNCLVAQRRMSWQRATTVVVVRPCGTVPPEIPAGLIPSAQGNVMIHAIRRARLCHRMR